MMRLLLRLLAILFLLNTAGCLLVIVKYPDGSDPPNPVTIGWRAVGSNATFSTMARGGNNVFFACQPCFLAPTPAPVGAEIGPTLPTLTRTPTPRPTLVTFTPTPTPAVVTPTPFRTPSPTPSASPTPTRTPPPTPTPTRTPVGMTPTPTPRFTPTASPTSSPTPSPTPTPRPTPTASPTPAPTQTPGPVPCPGRASNGLPAKAPIAQLGTEVGVNVPIEFRFTSDAGDFAKTFVRQTFRYDTPADTNGMLACSGDPTAALLVMYVAPKPAGLDPMINRRCSVLPGLFEDRAFCQGLGPFESWSYFTNVESTVNGVTSVCGSTCANGLCNGALFNPANGPCGKCYIPNVTATNRYGEDIFVPGTDLSSPSVARWKQQTAGQWEVDLGWDWQAIGVPVGGQIPTCCPACGGAPAGSAAACYCRICSACGGGAKTSGCNCTRAPSSNWVYYHQFGPTGRQTDVSSGLTPRLSTAKALFDASLVTYNETPTSILQPFVYNFGSAFWYTIQWGSVWPAGSKAPVCPSGVTACIPGATRPPGCAWCDEGHAGTCADNSGSLTGFSCYQHTDCGAGSCLGGQPANVQINIGAGARQMYGDPLPDPNHESGTRTHGPNTDGVQLAVRSRFDSQIIIADGSKAPWNYAATPTGGKFRSYAVDIARDLFWAKTIHQKNQYGCGGPSSEGGTNYTGPCTGPDVCAASCVEPTAVGHTGAVCQGGGCYQFMFDELNHTERMPAHLFFGVEGGWGSSNVTAVRNFRMGDAATIR